MHLWEQSKDHKGEEGSCISVSQSGASTVQKMKHKMALVKDVVFIDTQMQSYGKSPFLLHYSYAKQGPTDLWILIIKLYFSKPSFDAEGFYNQA